MRRVMIGLIVLAGCGRREKVDDAPPPRVEPRNQSREQPRPGERTRPRPASVGTTDAGSLHELFGRNAAAADAKYGGKYVTVWGQNHDITETPDGYLLRLVAGPPGHPEIGRPFAVVARYPRAARGELAKIGPVDYVRLTGKCVGKMSGSGHGGYHVLIEDCTPPAVVPPPQQDD